jgi:TatD DNase family protein
MFFDTHAHLYSEQFKEDQDAMIQRAISAGVERFYLPNIDLESIEGMLDLEKKYPEACFPMMGLHPCSVEANWEEVLTKMKTLIDERKFVAIGEIGIDLYWDKSTLDIQRECFIKQIHWAIEKNIPIVIHCRDAFDEIYEVLSSPEFQAWIQSNAIKGIFHCFSGTVEQANQVIALGFKLGIGGVVTYKNSGLDKVLEQIDVAHLVLETDAPYLTPVPHRGKRNESSYISHILFKVAEIKKMMPAKVAEITTKNAEIIFG